MTAMINFKNTLIGHDFRSGSRKRRARLASAWLRGLAFSLALSCLWSFVGAGVASAAQQRDPVPPKLHSPWISPEKKARMQAQAQKVKAMQERAGKPGFPYRAAIAQTARQAALHPPVLRPHVAPLTLLDQVGLLARPVPAARVASWYTEKNTLHPAKARLALLNLWMGEWELAHNQHPQVACPLFRQARRLSGLTQDVYGIAAYDDAMALFYEGAYADATDAFRHLEARHTGLRGYDYRTCSLWERHANACASYHAVRANLGIPEPPRLDPLCGVAALAACLQKLGIPASRQAVLNASHMTGEGNNLNDIEDAARKLGASAYPVSAEDKTVIALPKPLVAYVEHDHFVALIRADYSGVSYLCSDCGPWPGGRVNLTWAQWRQMNPGLYLAVTKPGSAWDQRLAANRPGQAAPAVRLAMNDPSGLHSQGMLLHVGGLAMPKGVTVLSNKNGHWVYCGGRYYSPICVNYQCCLTQGGGGPGGGGPGGGGPGGPPGRGGGPGGSVGPGATAMGPTADDPVNLASGEEEYTPTDLTVYNPHGPAVSWGRIYDSLQASDLTTGQAFGVPEQNDFGSGWSQTYNLSVQDAFGDTTNNKYVYAANGSRTAFVAPAVPSAATPSVLCNVQPGAPFVVYWNYDAKTAQTYFQVVNSDRSQWITAEQKAGTSSYFLIARQTDRNGNYIAFNYTTTDTGFPLLSTITNQDGTALLSVLRVGDGSGNIAQIADCYGRSIFYHVEKSGPYNAPGGNAYALALDHVSQIVPTGSTILPDRYVYGYQIVVNYEPSSPERIPVNYLHTITVPSPTGTGVSTATINYDTSFNGPLVTSLVDGNGNTTTFTSVDANGNPVNVTNYTQVSFYANGAASPTYTYTGSYDNSMNGTTKTDGAGNVLSTDTFSDPSNPFRPSSSADGNGNITKYVWDASGNMHQKTSPRGTVTNYTWAFPAGQVPAVVNSIAATGTGFSLGELVGQQEGTKSPTTYAYFEPSGLVSKVNKPLPGTVGTGASVSYSYQYDNFGNIVQMVAPGNNLAGTITTTLNYGTNPSLGLPLVISDGLGHTTRFTYDAQGNLISTTDALGNTTFNGETSGLNGYNIANQPLLTSYPATGQTGGTSAKSVMVYLYPGGPKIADKSYDESGVQIRETDTAYGQEGETLGLTGSTPIKAFTHDALYRPITIVDGNGNTAHYFYNQQGYLYQVAYPGAGATTVPLSPGSRDTLTYTSYDAKGNVLSLTDGNKGTTTYTYADVESRLTNEHYSPGSGESALADTAYAYDLYGRRITMTDATGSQTFGYDDNDTRTSNITTYTGLSAATVSYSYYPDGSRQSMSTPAGSFSYSYDAAGRLIGLTNPFSETTGLAYQDNNWLHAQSLADGVVTATSYNARGQTTDQATEQGGSTLADFAVPSTGGYDGAGNRLKFTATLAAVGTSGQTILSYDNRNEVVQEQSSRNGGYKNVFSYDGAENPTTFRNAAVGVANSNNQLPGPTYDGNGSPIGYNSRSLTFDSLSRLTSYGSFLSCGYRGDGMRGWKQSAAGIKYFLYDGNNCVCELSNKGAVTATNTFVADNLVSRRVGMGSIFYDFDLSGNVAQRLNGVGSVISTDTCDAFGARQTSDTTQDPFGFSAQFGGYTDSETGLVLLSHRYYDPQSGRWLTRDPISYMGGINVYGYCLNNPINSQDRSGMFSWVGGALSCAVAAVVAATINWQDPDMCAENKLCQAAAACIGAIIGVAVAGLTDNPCLGAIAGSIASALGSELCNYITCEHKKPDMNSLACDLTNVIVSSFVGCFLGSSEDTMELPPEVVEFLDNTVFAGLGNALGSEGQAACQFGQALGES